MSRLNFDVNNRGQITVGGRIIPTTVTDNSKRLGADDTEHQMLIQHLSPGNDSAVREIMQETEKDRYMGKLKPFVEGEPIGKLPRRVRPKRMTDAEVRKEHNKRMERQRDAMFALRARNEETLADLYGKR